MSDARPQAIQRQVEAHAQWWGAQAHVCNIREDYHKQPIIRDEQLEIDTTPADV